MTDQTLDYDYIIVGSGFGGSVSAHRLTEKGYKVAVIEVGKRYHTKDFPKSNWNMKKFNWMPKVGLYGIFRMFVLKHAFILGGAGVGGGSLVYANTLLVPPEKVWSDKSWPVDINWAEKMPVHYATAKQMLGVTENVYLGTADKLLKQAAEEQGYGDSFYKTNVGVYFGQKGVTVPDPYFGGQGPDRTGCEFCGGCMVGCRHNAKNTLDKNYLFFAEKNGAEVIPERRVTKIKTINDTIDGSEGYEVTIETSTSWFAKNKKVLRTKGVILSAGVLGSLNLMLNMKASGNLPRISDQLGNRVRTNSESLIGLRVHDKDVDVSDGIAIGSGFYINDNTHVEAVRYSKGADAISLTTTLMDMSKGNLPRFLSWLFYILRHPWKLLRYSLNPFGLAKSTLILLVMQTVDAYFKIELKRSILTMFKKTSVGSVGPKIPASIPEANEFADKMGKQLNATALIAMPEVFLDIPTTAHIMGGNGMGSTIEEGVINYRNEVFNYKNLMVCDGSMVGANLGVNPSLTITALTEQAMSHIPKKEAIN